VAVATEREVGLFIDGELVGGCDIVCEMYESGELEEALR